MEPCVRAGSEAERGPLGAGKGSGQVKDGPGGGHDTAPPSSFLPLLTLLPSDPLRTGEGRGPGMLSGVRGPHQPPGSSAGLAYPPASNQ